MKTPKAQTSLEYLMTYGWVILIMVVALIIVWQWGLFEPKTIPKGYSGFWGVVPEDFAFKSNGQLEISLKNDLGANITISKINAEVNGEVYQDSSTYEISAGGKQIWSHTFSSAVRMSPGSRFEIAIWIEYQDSRIKEDYRSSGKIWGSVEAA